MKKNIIIFVLFMCMSSLVTAEITKAQPGSNTINVRVIVPVLTEVSTVVLTPIITYDDKTGAPIVSAAANTITTIDSTGLTTAAIDSTVLTLTAVVDLSPAVINFSPDAANGIKLFWAAKQPANVYYNVYRADLGEYSKINKEEFAKNEYVDSNILSATVYYYKVEAKDLSGNAYVSMTQSVKSADVIMPYVSAGLKAFQDIQSVSLKWAQSGQGSFSVSGYNFYRGKKPEEMSFIKFMPLSKLYYTDDEVDPGVRYYYKMAAVDIKGNESKKSETVSAVPFPRSRTSICLMPTGYRNSIYDNMGFNMDMGFTYYIGAIFGEHNTFGEKVTDTFRKNGVWLLSLDAKWTFFNENSGWYPSIGLGLMYSLLMQDSIGGSTQNSANGGSATIGSKDKVLAQQNAFVVFTKNVGWDITAHLGYTQGFKMYKDDKGKGSAGYLTYIVSSILGGNSAAETGSQTSNTLAEVRNAYYFGLSREIVKKVGVSVELTVPLEFNKNPILPDTYIINTHIDRLFNFDIAYLHYDGGYAWIGYYNLKFSIFPSPYK